MLRRRGIWLAAALAVLLAPVVCSAQSLADRVPADALIYVGSRGTADLGPGYDQSHLKAILDKSEMSKLVNDALPALIAKYSNMTPDIAKISDIVISLGKPLLLHPTAFYVGPLDLTNQQQPVAHVAILCDAGADAANMAASANDLVKMAPPDAPVKIQVKTFGNLVVISTFDFAEHPEKALTDDADFKAAMAQVGKEPVFALYVDGDKFGKQIDAVVAASHDADAQDMWPKIRETLGLANLKRLAATDGFDGRDWMSQVFIEAPGPHTGLLSLLDGDPLSDDVLKVIPSTATMALAGQFDFAKLVTIVRQSIAKIDPADSKHVDEGIGQVNDFLGLDVQNDLLASFGTDWALYSDPTVTGYGSTGMTVINHARNADKLESSLSQLETLANKGIRDALAQEAPFLTLKFRQQKIDGNTIHFAALPLLTPAWTIKNGTWYFGMYPQVVVSAVAHSSGAKSILDNPAYQAVRKRLGGPEKINSVMFMDTPKLAPLSYQNVLMISRLFLGAGDLVGLDSPAMVLPTLENIMPELEPEGAISWTDATGWHAKSFEAFPGDSILASDGGGGASTIIQVISSLVSMGYTQQRQMRGF